jgi:muramidase (phage lysozyme)
VTPNLSAILSTISHSEGTDRVMEPYRCCFGFKHTIIDLTYHPHQIRSDGTREWNGEPLDFLGPKYAGEISSAAGRYQITLPTFMRLRAILRTTGFGPSVQDDMAVQLIKEQGALDLVMGGQVTDALTRCSAIWASLPGSDSGQPQTEIADLLHTYMNDGGSLA